MESSIPDINKSDESRKKQKKKFKLRTLRISLKYRPEILKLILKMRHYIRKKNKLILKLIQQFKMMEKSEEYNKTATSNDGKDINQTVTSNNDKPNLKDTSTQTEDTAPQNEEPQNKDTAKEKDAIKEIAWDLNKEKFEEYNKTATSNDGKDINQTVTSKNDKSKLKDTSTQTEDTSPIYVEPQNKDTAKEEKDAIKETAWDLNKDDVKSIAEQVAEAAQSALQESGMVYVESAGMYYDYKTGYYYNSELGLYYHTDTQCYYYYSEDKKEFVFHSYPDRSALAACASLNAHEKRKAKKNKKDNEDEASKPKRKKKSDKRTKKNVSSDTENENQTCTKEKTETEIQKDTKEISEVKEDSVEKKEEKQEGGSDKEDLEDGECSETESEKSDGEKSDGEESHASTSTASDDETVAKHHPPCMRVIVRETTLPKLKVGSLFLITKDGGTIGREGDQHVILIRDNNVSRTHLDIQYDMAKRMYTATDLGSKNGTLLNNIQMSESQVVSRPMEIMHGSTIQLGETKLLCHIHAGNDTCGHCEPGLLMETREKEKTAYTRTCNVQKQHQLELARLKNKYAPEPLMIEEGTYNDRAKARRETVGSSHHSVKTESTDLDTFIAPENKGFKLLEKMGWSKGEGLGKDCQGDVEPIPMVSNEGKAGLGTPGSTSAPPVVPTIKVRNTLGPATLRLATRTKMLQPPAKAFQGTMDEDSE